MANVRSCMSLIALLAACALEGGCLYVEGGGAVYGGSGGASVGWSVAGGVYVELGAAKASTGGGGSIVHHDGGRYVGAGFNGKVDVTAKKWRGDDHSPVLLRGTVAGSSSNGEDDDLTDDDHPGWSLFGGATLGLDVRKNDGNLKSITSETLNLWSSFGIDLVRAGGATFVGPSLRLGVGVNLLRLTPV